MLAWFTVRMFKEACLHNRLQTVRMTMFVLAGDITYVWVKAYLGRDTLKLS